MGTRLIARGYDPRAPLERVLLSHPDVVRDIHRSYVEAGARVVLTHTFRANRLALREGGLGASLKEINQRAVAMAQEAAVPRKVMVMGDIGPLAYPLGHGAVIASYEEQAEILLGCGVQGILGETMTSWKNAAVFLEAMRPLRPPFLGVLFSFNRGGLTFDGLRPADVWRRLRDDGVSAFGVNCGYGYGAAVRWLAGLVPAPGETIIAKPNAGVPSRGDALVYTETPEGIGTSVASLIAGGVTWIGGCCGTTAAHIREIAEAMNRIAKRDRRS